MSQNVFQNILRYDMSVEQNGYAAVGLWGKTPAVATQESPLSEPSVGQVLEEPTVALQLLRVASQLLAAGKDCNGLGEEYLDKRHTLSPTPSAAR